MLGLRLAHPWGPLQTEFWHFVVLEKDMPDELKTALRRSSANYNGVNGIFETVTRMEFWHELMEFYIREAWMLDERRFREWLGLFTENVFYFMPRGLNVHRHKTDRELSAVGDLAIFEDDKTYLRMRVDRLETGMAWGEDPPSRTRHLVGNLVPEPQPDGQVKARTAFILYRSHHETEENIFAGYRDDVLRRVDGSWRIARRTIVLDSNVILAKNLSVFF